ncbi:BPSL0761 family protein [Fulvimonas sp. R45]|uniref:BPSL0761 family protein n=1 Tax=Fulvimonas sp. R45 TaxID=3045937 RepID=UPI00265F110C|nr:BPSL0761 family protein [Fulvimonas sp. R45]
MTLPYERSRAVIETQKFLTLLLGDSRVPAAVRKEAKWLLRHYPSASQVFQAGWHELVSPTYVLEPIFDISIDGKPSKHWPTPPDPAKKCHDREKA